MPRLIGHGPGLGTDPQRPLAQNPGSHGGRPDTRGRGRRRPGGGGERPFDADPPAAAPYALALAKQAVYAYGRSGLGCGDWPWKANGSAGVSRQSFFRDLMKEQLAQGVLKTSEDVSEIKGNRLSMKVVGIAGSLRPESNTLQYVKKSLARLESLGLETELISLEGKTIKPCLGCYSCVKIARCVQDDDDFAEILEKMRLAEGMVSSVPRSICRRSPPRSWPCWRGPRLWPSGTSGFLPARWADPITVARRAGHNVAFSQLLLWFFINGITVPDRPTGMWVWPGPAVRGMRTRMRKAWPRWSISPITWLTS